MIAAKAFSQWVTRTQTAWFGGSVVVGLAAVVASVKGWVIANRSERSRGPLIETT
ncbi:hypothetical protein [Trinickia mobilis]|uniref:hypothetical protein n=1 Tax=Trinickia mobilis TaxID=2816356 RepID=UPI00286825D3|nr:hypothetical protein [Trinickia mobilis]